ncbi:MAG TPA: lipoyl synthase [bacterium]|nr:lipoyl synthase [bacterium]
MSGSKHGNNLRLPSWFKAKLPNGEQFVNLKNILSSRGLNTICDEAKCPNRGECWSAGSATFLLMGPVCSRSCVYCGVGSGLPSPLDPAEPSSVAEAVAALGLKYVVVTSVTRDDLPDGGAAHFALAVSEIRRSSPNCRVEVLAPDFKGDTGGVSAVLQSSPYVFGHNMETVEALFPEMRPQGDFSRSLKILEAAKSIRPGQLTKSGIMLGLGETDAQAEAALASLRCAGVDRVSLGQYLRPSRALPPPARYVTPEEFRDWERLARSLGFTWVKSGPNVRSSYQAEMDS